VVAELMGVDWETVGRIGRRLVAEARAGGDGLDGLRRIGVDEVSYQAGHHYLVVVTCQERARVVWVGAGAPHEAFGRSFTELGRERAARLEAISLDLAPHFVRLARRHAANAQLCADPFHLVAQAQFALDRLRAAHRHRLRGSDPTRARW
jgi:transposase